MTTATNTLEDIARRKSIPEEEIKKLVNFFINWISGDPTSIIKQEAYLQFGIEYWRKVLEDAKQVNFAKYGRCERAFWYQRRVIGDQDMSMGPTTEINRVNYLLLRK